MTLTLATGHVVESAPDWDAAEYVPAYTLWTGRLWHAYLDAEES